MKDKIFRIVIFTIGLFLCSYPVASSMMQRQFQKETVATHKKELASAENLEKVLEDARAYNSMLNQVGNAIVGDIQNDILSEESYNNQLNVSKNGIMGAIKIPKINVHLPIYHGTEEEVLANGVGHFEGSSLPVGGENTRSVLTSHRGLPNAKLFTRLDELENGDFFYIDVCGETLAYQVNEIQVIEPEDLEKLFIQPEKDLVTLVTCTPYGINSHRLLVTGERVEYEQKVFQSIKPQMYSVRELIFTAIPFVVVIIAVIMYLKNRKRCDNGKN